MTVIHSYKHGYGGLGDMLRSMFAYFVFCKLNDIEYYLDFSETDLHYCFDNTVSEKYKDFKRDKNIQMFKQIGSTSDRDTRKILEYIKNNRNKTVLIYSNIFDFIPFEELKEYTKDFIEFLKFSNEVISRADKLLKDIEIELGSYASIHVRCGDKFMNKINIDSDSRITHNQAITKIDKIMTFIKKRYQDIPVMLMTDNLQLKNRHIILQTKILDTEIHHTALVSIGTLEKQGVIDAVVEFYVMGHSKCIVSVKDSGFSFWASFLFDVPMYKLNEKDDIVKFNYALKYF
jgi:hypothetical protein